MTELIAVTAIGVILIYAYYKLTKSQRDIDAMTSKTTKEDIQRLDQDE